MVFHFKQERSDPSLISKEPPKSILKASKLSKQKSSLRKQRSFASNSRISSSNSKVKNSQIINQTTCEDQGVTFRNKARQTTTTSVNTSQSLSLNSDEFEKCSKGKEKSNKTRQTTTTLLSTPTGSSVSLSLSSDGGERFPKEKDKLKEPKKEKVLNEKLIILTSKEGSEDRPKPERPKREPKNIETEKKVNISNGGNSSEILEVQKATLREDAQAYDELRKAHGDIEMTLQDEKINIIEVKMTNNSSHDWNNYRGGASMSPSHEKTPRDENLGKESYGGRQQVNERINQQEYHDTEPVYLVKAQSIKKFLSSALKKGFDRKENEQGNINDDSRNLGIVRTVRWDENIKTTAVTLENDLNRSGMETWETLDEALLTMSETHDDGSLGSVSTQQVNTRTCCFFNDGNEYDGEFLNTSKSTYDMSESFGTFDWNASRSTYDMSTTFSTHDLGASRSTCDLNSKSTHDLNASRSSKFMSMDSRYTMMTTSTMGDDASVESYMSMDMGCAKFKVYLPNPVHVSCLSPETAIWVGDTFCSLENLGINRNTADGKKPNDEDRNDEDQNDEVPIGIPKTVCASDEAPNDIPTTTRGAMF